MTAATSRLRRRGIGAGVAALVGLGSVAGLAGAAQAAPGFDPSASSAQVAGVDRFDTAARIATATFTTAQTVVIANGDRVIDAQAAGYVAGQQAGGAPILLTQTNTVPQFTLDAIEELGATRAIVIGDDVSVSAAARAQLTEAGLTLTSLAGDNRFDTAADIYNTASTKSKTVFLARGDYPTGQVSPDALSAGPIAYKGTPILLTNATTLPTETRQALIDGGVTNVVVLGNGITDAVKAEVTAAVPGVSITTIAGADRSVTAQLLAESSYGSFYNRTSASIANGEKVDALAAGPWAATKGTPILLTLGTNAIGTGTTAYLDKYASSLVSATVFGDANSVPATFISQATEAADGGAVTSVIVTSSNNAGSFTWADPATKTNATATPKSTDTFTVNGTPATLGAFLGQVSRGDTLIVTPGNTSTTWALTNKVATDYTAGLVGNVNTSASGTDSVFSIIEPITGVALRTFPANSAFPAANTFYTVDGANATSATFLAALSTGDTVTVSGAGTAASPYTYALTNGTVTGTVTSPTKGVSTAFTSTFAVKTAAGAVLGDIPTSTGDTLFSTAAADSDVRTVDGASATAEAFAGALSAGDTVTVSRNGGVQTIALVNAAPTAVSGTYLQGTALTAAGTAPTFTLTDGTTFTVPFSTLLTVDGAVATPEEFNAASTPGDQLVYQAADPGTNTTGSLKLTNQNLTGSLSEIDTTNNVFDVYTPGTPPQGLVSNFNYSTQFFYDGNTSATYFVNGTSGNLAAFETELGLVANGSKTGTVTLVDNGLVTEYRLVTATNTAAPTSAGDSVADNSADTVALNFSKPVYWSAAPARGDFTFANVGSGAAASPALVAGTIDITSPSPTFANQASNTLGFTVASGIDADSGDITVTLTAQGAAKIKDANGVSPAAGTIWTVEAGA